MNQLTSTGTTQSGITSGVALQTVDDIQDERLVSQGYGYAEWCWNRLTRSWTQKALPARPIEAGLSFIDCSGR